MRIILRANVTAVPTSSYDWNAWSFDGYGCTLLLLLPSNSTALVKNGVLAIVTNHIRWRAMLGGTVA